MTPFRLTPQRGGALLLFLVALVLLIRLAALSEEPAPAVSVPSSVATRTPPVVPTTGAARTPRIEITRVPRPPLDPNMPLEASSAPLIAAPSATATLPPVPTALTPLVPTTAPPATTSTLPLPPAATPPATAIPLPPTPTPTASPVPSVRPKLINNEIVPAWWPCQPGQVKAIGKLGIYYVPDQPGYARSYAGITCFDSEQAAVAAGHRRAE